MSRRIHLTSSRKLTGRHWYIDIASLSGHCLRKWVRYFAVGLGLKVRWTPLGSHSICKQLPNGEWETVNFSETMTEVIVYMLVWEVCLICKRVVETSRYVFDDGRPSLPNIYTE